MKACVRGLTSSWYRVSICARAGLATAGLIADELPHPRAELGEWVTIPTTYAGGARSKSRADAQSFIPPFHADRRPLLLAGIDDLKLVNDLSNGKVDLTFGRYADNPLLCEGARAPLRPCADILVRGYSALDIFGGSQVKFDELVAHNAKTAGFA